MESDSVAEEIVVFVIAVEIELVIVTCGSKGQPSGPIGVSITK